MAVMSGISTFSSFTNELSGFLVRGFSIFVSKSMVSYEGIEFVYGVYVLGEMYELFVRNS